MIEILKPLEKQLEKIFVDSAPPLPKNARKNIAEYLPWINLILGLITLSSLYYLWHWAHIANNVINYANQLSASVGGPIITNRLGFGVWLGMAVLLVEALLYIAAFPALQNKRKSGWDLLFYAALVNVIYGIVMAFTSYGGIGSLIGAIIGSAIILYVLFQIRENYLKLPTRSKSSQE
jgi:hypothetical protein